MGRADGASKPSSSETPVSRLPTLVSDAVKMALIGLAYYVIARLSLRLALIEENVTPLWPPTGIALGLRVHRRSSRTHGETGTDVIPKDPDATRRRYEPPGSIARPRSETRSPGP